MFKKHQIETAIHRAVDKVLSFERQNVAIVPEDLGLTTESIYWDWKDMPLVFCALSRILGFSDEDLEKKFEPDDDELPCHESPNYPGVSLMAERDFEPYQGKRVFMIVASDEVEGETALSGPRRRYLRR